MVEEQKKKQRREKRRKGEDLKVLEMADKERSG